MAQDSNRPAASEASVERTITRSTLPDPTKKHLLELIADLDDLGRLDADTNEVYVDEGSLRKLLRKHGSRELDARVMPHLGRARGSKLVDASARSATSIPGPAPRLTRIRWEELVRRVDELRPLPDATVDALHLTSSSSMDEVNRAMKSRFPDVSESFFNRETLYGIAAMIRGSDAAAAGDAATRSASPDFWACLVDNMGFWAAMAALSVCLVISIAFFAALGPGGVFVWAVFWQALLVAGLWFVGLNLLTITFFCLGM